MGTLRPNLYNYVLHIVSTVARRQSKILRDTSTKLKHLMKRLAQVETDRTNQM